MRNGDKLDHVNRQLLTLLQQGLPVAAEPYLKLAECLGISQEEVFERIDILKKTGYIRRISGFFDSEKMGYHSILCAMEVPEEAVEKAAAFLDTIPGITHNYLRNHLDYLILINNYLFFLWLLLIEEGCKAGPVHRFPRVKAYKIRASFNLKEEKP